MGTFLSCQSFLTCGLNAVSEDADCQVLVPTANICSLLQIFVVQVDGAAVDGSHQSLQRFCCAVNLFCYWVDKNMAPGKTGLVICNLTFNHK